MSDKPCKSCNQYVELNIERCPKCGMKDPTKVEKPLIKTIGSFVLKLCMVFGVAFLALIIYAVSTTDDSKAWGVVSSTDKMTGKITSVMASSPYIKPLEAMPYPYSNIKAKLATFCSTSDSDETIFWTALLVDGGELNIKHDNKNIPSVKSRIKWDNQIEEINLVIDKIDKEKGFLYMHGNGNQSEIINKIESSSLSLVELQWIDQQKTYFEFNLSDAKRAINEMKLACESIQ